MIEICRHQIPELNDEIRLLDYVIKYLPEITTRNAAKKAIKKGLLTLDGGTVESGRFLKQGQVLILHNEDAIKKVFPLTLEKIYEDNYIAVVLKPAGISTSGNYFKTIENALPFNLNPSTASDSLVNPLPSHRLDNQTSGLLIIAKTKLARIKLGSAFESGEISKTYHAIVQGAAEGEGEIDKTIEGKACLTTYKTVTSFKSNKFNDLSLLELSPKTGRTHQLRIHLSESGTPIIGDKLYTKEEKLFKGKGLFLSATGITFLHPITGDEITLNVSMPHKFQAFLNRYTQA